MITPQKVRAVLRKAGFTRSESHTTMVRGWHSRSPGYLVARDRSGRYAATVEHCTGDLQRGRDPAFVEQRLTAYQAALDAAGLKAERSDDIRVIIVHLNPKGQQ